MPHWREWRLGILALLACLACRASSHAPREALLADLEPGHYEAGFRVRWISAPRSLGEGPEAVACDRRIRLLVWYPALGDHRTNTTLAMYVAAVRSPQQDSGNATGPATPWETARARDVVTDDSAMRQLTDFTQGALDRNAIQDMLGTRVTGLPRATPADGHYPLVILGNGFGPPFFLHWALGEYLAQRGYVAATIAGGLCTEPRSFDLRGVRVMERDLRAAVAALSAWPGVDSTRIGFVGWSGGSLAQVFVAATRPARAVVSLDGATGYDYGKHMLDSATWIDRTRFAMPYLHLTGDVAPVPNVAKSTTFYDSLARGPAYLVHVAALTHAQFTSLGVLAARTLGAARALPVTAGYEAVVQVTTWFLDAYVRDDSTARDRLRNPRTGLGSARAQLSSLSQKGSVPRRVAPPPLP